ncbi:membrane protein [Pontibacillus halophilus JSM 076056 = DSM 19796]|uniref:Membrane protein n=1 Tax=Pontibacillus halophilus JSM 076056 = DSM 19796 TaxID=1385510 RepID=A0A0A5GK75_9BACI|nr:membrane protein [Pontibacillus halophilus]KGX93686.1 membrane protein [Pontibacillus halophilus JSM 076056 = DSM 19796]
MIRSGFKWMFLIIGTMIGAGYASGRELWQFFGYESGLAILIFTVLFTLCTFTILSISYHSQSKHYLPVLRTIVGKRLSVVYDGMIVLYLFTTTVVMLAGSGATLQAFHQPYWFGIVLIVVPLVLVFSRDINGVLSLNTYILPLLIVGLLYVLIHFTLNQSLGLYSQFQGSENWTAAFPFTALNILPLIAVIGAVGNEMKSKGEVWISAIGSGVILGSISLIYNNSLIEIADDILVYEIPLFAILKHYSHQMFAFISMLLWIAIFTTAASGVLGLVTRFRSYFNLPLWVLASITLILMIPLTGIGFSTLIEYLYPLYGLLNLYVLSAILIYPFANRYKLD